MSRRLFEESDHAVLYAKHRPTCPNEIIKRIMDFLSERQSKPFEFAIDIGCGSGQATTLLTEYFVKVNGYDVSESQINEAKKLENDYNNLNFYTSSSEKIALEDSCVDLIVVAQAIHWFDLDLFFKECHKLLKPNGVLVFFGHYMPFINYKDSSSVLTLKLHELRSSLIPYEDGVLQHLRNQYKSIEPSFNEVKRELFIDELHWSLNDIVNWIHTWSYYRTYKTHNPSGGLLEKFYDDMRDILKESNPNEDNLDSVEMTLKREIFIVMCRD